MPRIGMGWAMRPYSGTLAGRKVIVTNRNIPPKVTTMKLQGITSKKVKALVRDHTLIWISPDATSMTAALLMRQHNIGALAVMEEDRLVGVLSERDIVQRCLGQGLDPSVCPVSQIMSYPPITIDRNMTISVAAIVMIEAGIRHLPVMAGQKVLGMISIRQVVEEFRNSRESSILRLAA